MAKFRMSDGADNDARIRRGDPPHECARGDSAHIRDAHRERIAVPWPSAAPYARRIKRPPEKMGPRGAKDSIRFRERLVVEAVPTKAAPCSHETPDWSEGLVIPRANFPVCRLHEELLFRFHPGLSRAKARRQAPWRATAASQEKIEACRPHPCWRKRASGVRRAENPVPVQTLPRGFVVSMYSLLVRRGEYEN